MRKILFNTVLISTLALLIMSNTYTEECNETPTLSDSDYSQSKGEFTDSRDGKVYKWVKIGDQIWMAENLSYTGNDIIHISSKYQWINNANFNGWCYYDDYKSYEKEYGVLYQWNAAKSACPDGWHIPSKQEWEQMLSYLVANGYSYDGVIGHMYIAKSLTSLKGWNPTLSKGTAGNNDYEEFRNKTNFNAKPAGYRRQNGDFSNIGLSGLWWTFSNNSYAADGIEIYYCKPKVYIHKYNKLRGMSVRCVKD